MKRLICLMAALMMLTFTGCGRNNTKEDNTTTDNGVVQDNDGIIDDNDNSKNEDGGIVNDAADGAQDVVDGAANAVDDAVGGVENAVDDMTDGNKADKNTTANNTSSK